MIKELPEAIYLETTEEVLEKLHECAEGGFLPIDTETTGLHPTQDHIVFWSFADLNHRYATKAYTLDALHLFLEENKDAVLLMHNAPYDIHMFQNAGFDGMELWKRTFCTQMISAIWDPDTFHGLKDLSWQILGIPPKKFREFNFSKVNLEEIEGDDFWQLVDYASKDAWLTISIFFPMFNDLVVTEAPSTRHNWTLWEYYLLMERPVAPVLWTMTRRGIIVDLDHLKSLEGPMQERLHEITSEFCQVAHQHVNLRSPKQLAELLFTKLGYPVVKKTGSGAPSTDREAISKLLDKDPRDQLLNALQEYRTVDKLLGTYVVALPTKVVKGRVHTNIKQAAAATGRLASDNPNLQNIPTRSKEGKRIREAFRAGPGKKLVVADYGQIEIRVLAHLSGADSLVIPILEGRDMHTLTASRMFEVSYDAIAAAKKVDHPTEEEAKLCQHRDVAKTINFGVLYGLTAFGLMKNLKDKADMVVTKEEAQAYLDTYWGVHDDVREFFDECAAFSEENGYIMTHFGRRRSVFWPKGRRQWQARSEAQRRTYNTPIQGTASEIMKMAMVLLEADEELRELGAEMLLQVHDEVIFEVPEENAKRALERVIEIMKNPGIELLVPYTVDGGVADNWAEAK